MPIKTKTTQKIFSLPPDVVAKIAAGEVIERPVYAVKELVENALDAGADRLVIHLEAAGLQNITVIDNGVGMSKEDLQESFKLHTTSKLQTAEQLAHIATLGFRGEALASIAAVSNLTMQSRSKNQTSGTQVIIKNGKLEKIPPIGMPRGTTVIVSNLFHSVPARKKFLKSVATEFRHILNLLIHVALANPNIHLSLSHNKKTIFDLPKTQGINERIQFFLGEKTLANLLSVAYQDGHISLKGFIGRPQETGTQKQFLFVNKRKITDKRILLAVKDAYSTILPAKAQPTVILFLDLPHEFVDVNVHPRKEFVRFADTTLLYTTITAAVAQTLAKNNLSFSDETEFGLLTDKPLTKSFAGRMLKENQIPWDIRLRDIITTDENIIQIHTLYLVTQTKFGIMLIDQHAAHERILYEQFLKSFQQQQQESPQYHLPKQQVIELSFNEKELLTEHQQLLKHLGFELEEFKKNQFFIQALPLIFQDRNPVELISELLNDLAEEKKLKSIDEKSAKMIAYLACRAAVKAGESLDQKQMRDLLKKLEKTNNNATCPHGRPTKILIDLTQLHKMFKRK